MAVVGVRNLAFAVVVVIFLTVFWQTSGGTRTPTSWMPKEPEFKGFAPLPEGIVAPPVKPDLDVHEVVNAPAANPLPVLPGGGQVKNEVPGLSNSPFAAAPATDNTAPLAAAPGSAGLGSTAPIAAGNAGPGNTSPLGAGNVGLGSTAPQAGGNAGWGSTDPLGAGSAGVGSSSPFGAGNGVGNGLPPPLPATPGLGSSPQPPAVQPGLGSTLGSEPPTAPPASDDANFQGTFSQWQFQQNLDLSPPKIDTIKLRRYRPHNYKGEGHPTYATYVATPGGNLNEPYFVAAQQLIYRTLWDPRSGGEYPFTAFVAPHITEEQRNLLAAAGAIVRELEPVEWHPVQGTFARWKYQFAKLNMWKQTDFSRIFFLDSDAFPVKKIDDVFDTPQAHCKQELLPAEDQKSAESICTYTFMASPQNLLPSTDTGIMELNTGVMLLEPNIAMHTRLMREMPNTEKWNTAMADQGFLSEMFKAQGSFPVTSMSREYNGFFPGPQDEGRLKVVHEKLWIDPEQAPWAKGMFSSTHKAMKDFYESDIFVAAREKDGLMY